MARCNDNISDQVTSEERFNIEGAIRAHCQSIFNLLRIDQDDPNTKDTARRWARMIVRDICRGRFEPRPDVTDFPNTHNLDEVVIVGPTRVRSTCAHHFCPIEGTAVVGIIPDGRIIGLSKFARLTDWVMARPQIQEEATIQLADVIEDAISPRALAVIVRARHTCMTWRGVREHDSWATTSVMRGLFRDNAAARAELLTLMRHNGGG